MIAGRLGDVAGIYLPETRRHLTDVMREMQVSAGEAVVRLVEELGRRPDCAARLALTLN